MSRTSARVEQARSVTPTKTNDSFVGIEMQTVGTALTEDSGSGSNTLMGQLITFTPRQMSEAVFEPRGPGSRAHTLCIHHAALLKAGAILLVFWGQLPICLWFSGATDLELFGRPVFLGSENREIKVGWHHQEGSPLLCGQVNARGRRGRDSG